jgi:hypothetical protein
VAGAGFAQAGSQPGATFPSFKNKATNVLQESFLMITDIHLIELHSSKLDLSTGIGKSNALLLTFPGYSWRLARQSLSYSSRNVVTFAITIDMTAKLKFC